MSRLGDTIRAGREKKGMTLKALGKKCGVSESFIAEVESGRRIVSDDQAQRILKVLGVQNPVSTELEVAQEAPQPVRPRPRPYVLPVERTQPEASKVASAGEESGGTGDAWLDALGGVVKRVPILGEDGVVIDHRLLPVIGGKIEGGAPDKVLIYRCPDDALRGFRIYAGDLLLTVPASSAVDDAIMLLSYRERRLVRKVRKLDGGRLMLQSYDREFSSETTDAKNVLILGHCVRLERPL